MNVVFWIPFAINIMLGAFIARIPKVCKVDIKMLGKVPTLDTLGLEDLGYIGIYSIWWVLEYKVQHKLTKKIRDLFLDLFLFF